MNAELTFEAKLIVYLTNIRIEDFSVKFKPTFNLKMSYRGEKESVGE